MQNKISPICILAALLSFAILGRQTFAADYIDWPSLKNTVDPRVNSTENLIAVGGGNDDGSEFVRVYRIESDGKIGRLVWNSLLRYPYSLIRDYSWWGDQLILSKADSTKPIADEMALDRLLSSKGNTVLVNPVSSQVTQVLDEGCSMLAVHEQKLLACSPAPNYNNPNASAEIKFYQWQDAKPNFKKLGEWRRKDWGPLERATSLADPQSPRMIGWTNDGSGVLLVGPTGSVGRQEWMRTSILLATPDGKTKDWLPPTASVDTDTHPVVDISGNAIWLFGHYLAQAYYFMRADSTGLGNKTSFGDLLALRQKNVQTSPQTITRFVGTSPNGRYIFLQDGELASGVETVNIDLWIVDIIKKRRRKIVKMPPVKAVAQWIPQGAILETYSFQKNIENSSFGLYPFPEGNLPTDDPRLDKLVAQAPWEDASPPKPPLTPAQKAASDFLAQPDVAAVSRPEKWQKPRQIPALLQNQTSFALGQLYFDDALIALDAANHVTAFTSPPPHFPLETPLPDQPISPEQARDAALNFARRQRPTWFQNAAPTVEKAITWRATYRVPIQGPNAAQSALVEVRASDGKIAAYLEGESASLLPTTRQEGATGDSAPVLSPGGKIALLSTRPRAGYPAWWPARGNGLFLASTNDGTLKNIAPYAAGPLQWSADGRYLAFVIGRVNQGERIAVYDTQTGQTFPLPEPKTDRIMPRLLAWKNAEELLVGWIHQGAGGLDLMSWKPSQPAAPPQILIENWSGKIGTARNVGQFALVPESQKMYFTWRIVNDIGSPCTYSVWEVPLGDWNAPRQIVPCAAGSEIVQSGPDFVVVRFDDYATVRAVRVDTKTGQITPWKPPAPVIAARGSETTANLMISPDGSRAVFIARDSKTGENRIFEADLKAGTVKPLGANQEK